MVRSCPVLGQAHPPSRRLLVAAALALAALAIPALGVAGSGRSVPTLRGQADALAAKQRSATLGLYALDQQLAGAEARLQSLHAQAHTLRLRRASLEQRLGIARRSARIAQQRLGLHVRALYERGDVSTLEVVIGSKNLDDALTNIDDLNRVADQDEEILRAVTATRAQLGAAVGNLNTQATALAAATRDADATAASLIRSRADRTSYLVSLARQRQLTDAQIASVIAQAKAAQERTAALERAAQLKAAAAAKVASSGASVPPAPRRPLLPSTSVPGYTASSGRLAPRPYSVTAARCR